MPFTPMTGTGAVITLATVAFKCADASIKMEREAIECTPLSFFYKAYLAGRINGTMSVNCYLSAASAEHTAQVAFLSQAAVGTAIAFTYVDALSTNTYSGECIITSYTQTTKGDSAEMVAIELQIVGVVAV